MNCVDEITIWLKCMDDIIRKWWVIKNDQCKMKNDAKWQQRKEYILDGTLLSMIANNHKIKTKINPRKKWVRWKNTSR